MKRTFTFLLTSLFLGMGTMWAQTEATRMTADQLNAVTEKQAIAIECTQITNYNRFYDHVNGDNYGLTSGMSNSLIYYWVPVDGEPGAFYLMKGDGEGDYLQANNITTYGTVDNAAKFHAVKPYNGGAGVENFSGADCYYNKTDEEKATWVRLAFLDNSKWFNFNGKQYNGGTGVWTVLFVHDMTALADGVEVTYIYKVDGNEYDRATVPQEKNSEVSAPEKAFLTIENYEGTIGESDCEVVVNCSAALPFVAAADVENISAWYYVQMHSNQKKYIQYLTDQAYIEWVDTELDETAKDSYAWAFVGNLFDGFKMVNKAAAKALQSTAEGAVTMVDYAEGSKYILATTRETSEAAKAGFCLRNPGNNEYLNASAGKVAHWWDNDAGSVFLIELVPEEPVLKTDYTDAIKNASVSENVDWEGGLSHGNGGLYKTSAEAFDFTQTILLPAGQYKMTAQAAYRYAGSNDGPTAEEFEYNQIQAGAETHLAKLYAQTATYKYEANVQNRWEGASETDLANGDGVSMVNGKYVPNSSNAVKTWFNNGMYVNELVFNVQEEGEVKIGVAKASKAPNGDYTNIGAWTLTRLGDAEADPEVVEPEPEVTVAVDVTNKVNTTGWICENGKPNTISIDGISMTENFQDGQTSTSASTTGVVLWQDVTGLENGKYTVELWANARVTWQESPATDGQENLTYLCANNVEISMKVFLNPDLNNNATYVLEGVEVTDGTLHIEMNKKEAGSNWHSIQIKSLTYYAPAGEAYEAAKADLKAALDAAAAVSPATEALTAAIAAAQAIYDASTDIEEIKAAVAPLQNATTLVVNTNAVAGATVASPVAANFVVNGTFDSEIAPWKSTTGAQNQALASNQQGAFTGNFFENWNGSNYTGKLYQVIENIPNGGYELSICAFVETFDGAAQYVYANGDKVALTTGAPTAYKVLTIVTDNKIEVGFEQAAAVNRWSGIDNVSLAYYGADASIAEMKASSVYIEYNKVVGQPMDVAVSAAMETAKAAYESGASDETLAVFTSAVQAATASVNAYATNKLAIDAMFALMESTNVYTAEAYAAYAALAEDYLAQYEAGTLTATVDNPATVHGWHADVAYDDLLLSAFGTNNFDTDLYINTWSTEGENDGSEFKVPFFEYWTGDDNSLPATTKTATVTGLVPGKKYEVEAWIRVRAKNGVAAADATGITLSVSEGISVDVTDGEVIGTSQFSVATFKAVGTADAEGNLTINFNVLDGNNISWLSFKNVKYTEAPVVEVEGVNLNTTQVELTTAGATFQLEAVIAPAEATDQTITWTTSDEEVATVDETGLVTAVGNGMAQITAAAANGVKVTCYVIVEIVEDGIDKIDADASSVIYDIHGRRVAKMVKGLYVVNGKKVFVK